MLKLVKELQFSKWVAQFMVARFRLWSIERAKWTEAAAARFLCPLRSIKYEYVYAYWSVLMCIYIRLDILRTLKWLTLEMEIHHAACYRLKMFH